tara:strand:- start:543 stop:1001 length:459 start_codon:yes stop_codon:yes gene_type:complete
MTNLNTTLQVKIKKIRVGRGIGSGKGKTSGRGVKGQKSRSGVAIKSFEGGQMPLYRRLPKRGFNQFKKNKVGSINLDKIQKLFDENKINSEIKIDINILKKLNVISKKYNKIKILGNGEIKKKIEINADYISKSAQEKLKKIGATVNLPRKV